jgi:hypothetical protein
MEKLKKGLLVMFVLFYGCFSVFAMELSEAKGKTFYTKVNMWFESKGRQPIRIPSTNYHKTILIPVGSKITVDGYNGESLLFTVDELKMKFNYVIISKHTQESISDIFTKLFSDKDVTAFGTQYTMFSSKEKENIKNGTITAGMSKDSVIMAYGYPPSHMTPSLSDNLWIYWESRFRKEEVTFKDDKVIDIRR